MRGASRADQCTDPPGRHRRYVCLAETAWLRERRTVKGRAQVLEMLVGYEKRGLQAEIENLRRSLRDGAT